MKIVNISLFFMLSLILNTSNASQQLKISNEIQVKSLKHVRGNFDCFPSIAEDSQLVLLAPIVIVRPLKARFRMPGIDGAALDRAGKKIETVFDSQDDSFAQLIDKSNEELKAFFKNKILVHYKTLLLGKIRTFKMHSLWHEFATQVKKQKILNKAQKRVILKKPKLEKSANGLILCPSSKNSSQ